MRTTLITALTATIAGAAAMAIAGGAQAAEITLYEHVGFGGGQLTLRGYTPNIVNTGFNDRASSLVVESGRWELCTDAEFKGKCAIFTRGEYPELERGLNDRFSSAREVGSYGDRRDGYNDYGRGAIQLYGGREFGGRSIQLAADTATLKGSGFDDRASSVVVTQGYWELCSDENFAGTCRRYAPGRYADLGYGMAREVSSARLLRSPRDAPAVISPGARQAPPTQVGRAILYSMPGLRGASMAVAGPVPDLERSNFNDSTESLYVESGTWTACREAYFRGDCREFAPGRYDDLRAAGFDRAISSLRPTVAAPPAPSRPTQTPAQAQEPGIEFFAEPEYAGQSLILNRNLADFVDRFNDRAESLRVHAGTWEVCTDARYGGTCAVFRPGAYPRLGGMSGRVSSARLVQ